MKLESDIHVRFAEFDDLDKVNNIRKQVNELHVNGRPDIFRPGFCEEMQKRVYDVFNSDSSDIIVAEYDGIICGFAAVQYILKPISPYSLERKIYQVEEFGVDEAYRRRGIATMLIAFMKSDARKRGYDKIELDMWEFNETAYQFYSSVGFKTYRRYMELAVTGYPTRKKAHLLLSEAESQNPGAWVKHSIVVAKCAELIAKNCDDLDPQKAYVLGLLHDIGRRFGVSHFKHIYDGYTYMNQLGYTEAARICLTHSFSVQNIDDYIGDIDVSTEIKHQMESALKECVYDDYDRLIQLCDAVGMSIGAVPIIKRMNDVKRRYGSYPQRKWDKNIELLHYFSSKTGMDIEKLTSGITADSN